MAKDMEGDSAAEGPMSGRMEHMKKGRKKKGRGKHARKTKGRK